MTSFVQLNELCDKDPVTDWLSTNYKLRILRGWNWNAKLTFEKILEYQELRANHDVDNITFEAIGTLINWHMYAYLGNDRCGRPVMYARLRNIDIAASTVRTATQFSICVLDAISAIIPPNCDQFVYIYDCEGMGYRNFQYDICKTGMQNVQVSFS